MTVNLKQRLAGRSALQAFRDDLPLGGGEPTREDNEAILVATLMRQSLMAAPAEGARIRVEALALARESLGADVLAEGCTYDERAAESDIDILRLLSQRVALAGRVNLAQHLLETAAELARDPMDSGRLLSDRSRNSRKQGQLDLSEEQALELLRRGTRAKSDELVALAAGQLASIAQVRGNFVAMRERLEESIAAARRGGLTRLIASAEAGLGVHAAYAGRYGDAVTLLWSAYRRSRGKGTIALAALGNLAQTLLICGRPEESRKIATLILQSRPPMQNALPVLGGYALSSARLSDASAVTWACDQVRMHARSRHHAREVAGALVECGLALELIGREAQAGVLRRRAEAIAAEHGFHDLTFSEGLRAWSGVAPDREPFAGEAEQVAAEIASLEVPRFEADVRLVFA